MAHSSTEAEIIALDAALREVQYVRQLLHAMGGPNQSCVDVFVDNESMIKTATNPIQKGRNRHMPIRYFYFRTLSLEGQIKLLKVPSELNVADLLVTYKSVGNFDALTKFAKGYTALHQ